MLVNMDALKHRVNGLLVLGFVLIPAYAAASWFGIEVWDGGRHLEGIALFLLAAILGCGLLLILNYLVEVLALGRGTLMVQNEENDVGAADGRM